MLFNRPYLGCETCVFTIKCWSGLDQLLVDVLGVVIEFSYVLESAVGKISAVVVVISWGSSASLDFNRCVLVGSNSNADVDFSRWCTSAYPAVARDRLLRVISCWYFSCDDQQRALRDSEVTTFCEQEPAVGFVSVFCSG
ncbi:hypothetical protein F511_39287 [Dorcoceras hygrometricum]|uniref:Uncharacterized protein n=1 Tax=Dorcoceras hygrometricum TaxID=472368 RepID=A0A2Z7DDQ5_9LAMI|nr:hypothetical protein F511_39287 [Dorcoceras hygrometricum]